MNKRILFALLLPVAVTLNGCGSTPAADEPSESPPQTEVSTQAASEEIEDKIQTTAYIVTFDSEYITMHQSADEASAQIARLYNGDHVDVYRLDGEWYRVGNTGLIGYIPVKNLSFDEPVSTEIVLELNTETEPVTTAAPALTPAVTLPAPTQAPAPQPVIAETSVPAGSGDGYQMILNNQTVNVVIVNGYVDPYVYFVDYGYIDYGYSQERNAVCNTKSVHIYQTPDTNGPKREAEMLYQDDALTVYGEIDGYYYISVHAGDGTEFYGYVPKKYILYPVAAVEAGLNYAATAGYVKVKSCTLRNTPSQADDNNVITYLYKDDTFTISDTANDYWYYITCKGYSGYVNHKMVTVY